MLGRGTLRGVPDSYKGFAFTVPIPTRHINAAGRGIHVAVRSVGVRGGRPHLLVVAKDVFRATEIARSRVLAAMFVDAGPEVLARARRLGIRDNDAGIDDGQAP
jgi:hypothetical protein